jgi:hypothetical protein
VRTQDFENSIGSRTAKSAFVDIITQSFAAKAMTLPGWAEKPPTALFFRGDFFSCIDTNQNEALA